MDEMAEIEELFRSDTPRPMEERKDFSQKAYKENDPKAKKNSAGFLVSLGICNLKVPVEEQPECHKEKDLWLELILTKAELKLEAERKLSGWMEHGRWDGWPSLDIPFRKEDSQAHIHIMFNYHWDTLAVTRMSEVLRQVNDKFVYKGQKPTKFTKHEHFFRMPLEHSKFFTKKNGIWIPITQYGEVVMDKYDEYLDFIKQSVDTKIK